MSITTIDAALEALRQRKPIIVVDDEGRENEGDLIISAQLATAEWIAFMVRHTSGYLCAPLTGERADELGLPLMVLENEDSRQTAYTITVDAADRDSTGISADDRAHTLRVLANPAATPADLRRPGHIVPLRAVEGGVRQRAGHTEAAVELMQLAGLEPVAAIGELVEDTGEMRRLPSLIAFGDEHGLPVITIADLIDYLDAVGLPTACKGANEESARVSFEVETNVPTRWGTFRMAAYRDRQTGADHVAIIAGRPSDGALVRVHSECLTGEALHSLKCECGPQLDAALQQVQESGNGMVVYLRGQEGRGIGLINKLKAYRLQEDGLDTLDANLALGLPADAREYGAAAAILKQQGLGSIRLLSNNPLKQAELEKHGVEVSELVPLLVGVGDFNEQYLQAKRDRMGHQLPAVITQNDEQGEH
ncbi:3,4-dihydroxy-2-butanone-4-phosphate synthase [Agrococcus sp. Marseille-Q4369]|uniref:3,4-dihydroxy-2-butanone-4-phosphate synthase n=1 Tax=Agrococcus sp. Marseille-Q4369 TaxID=2810513 RepID=UPI001B8D5D85|nr:3,4-dihydroxy-2-butanone-4-phosphate synthase [Agrococcus sp. Marseille-Q4369]QUW18512.1 3,4-dihydroxy-2-butanone-4-phosphate synthase [Agrococcus sp. Marseille-Q4369]